MPRTRSSSNTRSVSLCTRAAKTVARSTLPADREEARECACWTLGILVVLALLPMVFDAVVPYHTITLTISRRQPPAPAPFGAVLPMDGSEAQTVHRSVKALRERTQRKPATAAALLRRGAAAAAPGAAAAAAGTAVRRRRALAAEHGSSSARSRGPAPPETALRGERAGAP